MESQRRRAELAVEGTARDLGACTLHGSANMWLGYRDREEAGRALADRLRAYGGRDDVVVLGLPRGGVAVAAVVAEALGAELDVMIVRKVGYPGMPELALGAVAAGGIRFVNPEFSTVPADVFERMAAHALEEVERRARAYRGDRPLPELRDKIVILVDDGIATGATMRAAILALREEHPKRIIVAAPVAPPRTVDDLKEFADEVVCDQTPEPFYAIGEFYEDFTQLGDRDVERLLARAWGARARESIEREVTIRTGSIDLSATLSIPPAARGIVLFAHGSGSSRFSPRNRSVAKVLDDAGFATLLLDLLTPEEDRIDELTREYRFDIPRLAERLVGAIDWVRADPSTRDLEVGLFGASTGAAAALIAAARRPEVVRAVVSRGGRPDLAGDWLERVRAPTLLIVGQLDREVLKLNRWAALRMQAETRIEIVPGATHLFEEPGALGAVAQLASLWFERVLSAREPALAMQDELT